jgi:hypothetical protein
VRCGSLLEVRVYLLDENRFRLVDTTDQRLYGAVDAQYR